MKIRRWPSNPFVRICSKLTAPSDAGLGYLFVAYTVRQVAFIGLPVLRRRGRPYPAGQGVDGQADVESEHSGQCSRGQIPAGLADRNNLRATLVLLLQQDGKLHPARTRGVAGNGAPARRTGGRVFSSCTPCAVQFRQPPPSTSPSPCIPTPRKSPSSEDKDSAWICRAGVQDKFAYSNSNWRRWLGVKVIESDQRSGNTADLLTRTPLRAARDAKHRRSDTDELILPKRAQRASASDNQRNPRPCAARSR